MSCSWISAEAMAEKLGVHKRTVIRWALEGKLTYARPGARHYYFCPVLPTEGKPGEHLTVPADKLLVEPEY